MFVGFREKTAFSWEDLQLPQSIPTLKEILHPEDGSEKVEEPYTTGDKAKVHNNLTDRIEYTTYDSGISLTVISSLKGDEGIRAISQHDYNRLNRIRKMKEITLSDQEAVLLYDGGMNSTLIEETVGREGKIGGYRIQKVQWDKFGKYLPANYNGVMLVVPDNAASNLGGGTRSMVAVISGDKLSNGLFVESLFMETLYQENGPLETMTARTQLSEYSDILGKQATIIFISLYIGFVLLLSCATILALQQLTEAQDNRENYRVLSKIGADDKMLSKALFYFFNSIRNILQSCIVYRLI